MGVFLVVDDGNDVPLDEFGVELVGDGAYRLPVHVVGLLKLVFLNEKADPGQQERLQGKGDRVRG